MAVIENQNKYGTMGQGTNSSQNTHLGHCMRPNDLLENLQPLMEVIAEVSLRESKMN